MASRYKDKLVLSNIGYFYFLIQSTTSFHMSWYPVVPIPPQNPSNTRIIYIGMTHIPFAILFIIIVLFISARFRALMALR